MADEDERLVDERLVIETEDLPEVDLPERIVITLEDLPPDEPEQRQRIYPAIGAGDGLPAPVKGKSSLAWSNIARNLIAGLIGGFIGWIWVELLSGGATAYQPALQVILQIALVLSLFGATLGAVLGCSEGVATGVWPKALRSGAVGLGAGLVGGFLGGGAAQAVYGLLEGATSHLGLVTQILIRGLAWAVVGLIVGLGQGMAYQSSKKIVNGLLGGAIGGLAGGLLFDPIGLAIGGGTASRLIGFTIMGVCTGGAIGLVDEMRKEAWLRVVGGPLAGKEYILFNEVTTIGGSPKCDIVIYKDAQVAPVQAAIRIQGNRYLLTDSNLHPGTFLNGRLIAYTVLTSGQTIEIGSTIFLFCLRPARGTA